MSLRNGHGAGAGQPRIEVMPADELPAGVPDPRPSECPPVERSADGRLTAEGARKLGSLGGRARAGKTRLARRLRLGETFADPRFEPYASAARDFRRAHVATLARAVGGGYCGPAPASIVASAALQLAASRFAFEVLGDMALGSRLADASRQNLLAAHELCAREAQARPRGTNPVLAAIEAAGRPAGELSDPGAASGLTVSENASQGQPRAGEPEA